jgi:hypothetical protein
MVSVARLCLHIAYVSISADCSQVCAVQSFSHALDLEIACSRLENYISGLGKAAINIGCPTGQDCGLEAHRLCKEHSIPAYQITACVNISTCWVFSVQDWRSFEYARIGRGRYGFRSFARFPEVSWNAFFSR